MTRDPSVAEQRRDGTIRRKHSASRSRSNAADDARQQPLAIGVGAKSRFDHARRDRAKRTLTVIAQQRCHDASPSRSVHARAGPRNRGRFGVARRGAIPPYEEFQETSLLELSRIRRECAGLNTLVPAPLCKLPPCRTPTLVLSVTSVNAQLYTATTTGTGRHLSIR
jgi:hypothetical protein